MDPSLELQYMNDLRSLFLEIKTTTRRPRLDFIYYQICTAEKKLKNLRHVKTPIPKYPPPNQKVVYRESKKRTQEEEALKRISKKSKIIKKLYKKVVKCSDEDLNNKTFSIGSCTPGNCRYCNETNQQQLATNTSNPLDLSQNTMEVIDKMTTNTYEGVVMSAEETNAIINEMTNEATTRSVAVEPTAENVSQNIDFVEDTTEGNATSSTAEAVDKTEVEFNNFNNQAVNKMAEVAAAEAIANIAIAVAEAAAEEAAAADAVAAAAAAAAKEAVTEVAAADAVETFTEVDNKIVIAAEKAAVAAEKAAADAEEAAKNAAVAEEAAEEAIADGVIAAIPDEIANGIVSSETNNKTLSCDEGSMDVDEYIRNAKTIPFTYDLLPTPNISNLPPTPNITQHDNKDYHNLANAKISTAMEDDSERSTTMEDDLKKSLKPAEIAMIKKKLTPEAFKIFNWCTYDTQKAHLDIIKQNIPIVADDHIFIIQDIYDYNDKQIKLVQLIDPETGLVKPEVLIIKTFKIDSDSDYPHRMMREIKNLTRLAGFGIPKVKGVCFYLNAVLLEYCGSTLGEFIEKNNQIPMPLCYKIMKDLVMIVSHIVSCGMVHGDLHINNICIIQKPNKEYVIKIIDFDGAMEIDTESHVYKDIPESELNKYSWVAPEVTKGFVCSEQTEVFSLATNFIALIDKVVGQNNFVNYKVTNNKMK